MPVSRGPIGNRHPLGMRPHPMASSPCAGEDRWISVAVMRDDEWEGLVSAMKSPEWATSPDFANARGRCAHIDTIHERLAEWTAGFDDFTLADRLQQAGVAAAPVLTIADLLDSPHYKARGTYIEVDHPLGFSETIYGAYVKLSRTPAVVRPGPWIGQDNDHVFLDLLGLAPDRYQALKDDEVIY